MNNLQISDFITVYELPRGEGNPRNSEGDFAVLKNGKILFAYSRYTGSSEDDDAPCSIGALISSDSAQSFEKLPLFLARAEEHGTMNIMSVSFCRLESGTLCMFYLCKYGEQSEYVMCRCIDEDKLIFDKAETVIPRCDDAYYVVNNCRVLKLSDGSLIVPAAMHRITKGADGSDENSYFAESRIYKGDPEGKNWNVFSPDLKMPNPGYSQTGLQEPGAAELPDKRLYAYFRTDRAFQYESFYSDETGWNVPVPSKFSAPESPMLIKRSPYSGIYYAVWNPVPNYNGRLYDEKRWIHAGRNPLVIAQSKNGIDFSRYTVLENDPGRGFCYPAILFLNEKEMLISYCCGGEEDGNCLTRTVIKRIRFKI